MNSRPELKLDWCDVKAARFSVKRWHYSKRMPSFKTVKIGAWENGKFIGVVIFGQGATPEIAKPFGLKKLEVCELVRVALGKHDTPVTRIVSVALKMLKRQSPGIKLVVSFADSAQGHIGGIYQGGNWVYVGSFSHHVYVVHGVETHPKTLHSRYGKGGQSVPWLRKNVDPNAERIGTLPKHKYAYAVDHSFRAKLESMAKPYPKRAPEAHEDVRPPIQGEGGGSSPTPALQ